MNSNKLNKDVTISHHHVLIMTSNTTLVQLVFKILPAFIGYLMVDYGFTYSFIAIACSIGSLATGSSFILTPLLLHLPTNIAYTICSLSVCIGITSLYFSYNSNKLLFIIGVVITSIAEIIFWGSGNTVISSFQKDQHLAHKYLALLNASWTLATFLFFPVGFIMHFKSWWFLLELLFVLNIILAIINFTFMPKVSINKYNLARSTMKLPTVSIKSDLKILCNIKHLRIVWLIIVLIFIGWGYFYTSYGLWLKNIFNLNQSQFGVISGFVEGFGNLLGLLFVTFFTKSGDDSDTHESGEIIAKNDYKISLQTLTMLFVFIGLLIVITLSMVNSMSWYNDIFIYVVIGLFFMSMEAAAVALLMLNVTEVPCLQQPRASSMIGIIQSCTVFVAQVTVAPIYESGGMMLVAWILVVFYVICFVFTVYLWKIMKHTNMNEELEWINKHSQHNLSKYT
eukprot:189345_1